MVLAGKAVDGWVEVDTDTDTAVRTAEDKHTDNQEVGADLETKET